MHRLRTAHEPLAKVSGWFIPKPRGGEEQSAFSRRNSELWGKEYRYRKG